MPYWMVYTRCPNCEQDSCLQCTKDERELTLHVIQSNEMPPNSLNGPCATPDEMLKRIGQFFDFDESGKIIFKVS